MLKPNALTTLSNLKEALGLQGSSEDGKLERIINRATTFIESQTNRKLKARRYGDYDDPQIHPDTRVDDEDYLYFSGSLRDQGDTTWDGLYGVYYLPAWPVQTDTDFVLSALSNRVTDTWTNLTENVDYLLDRENGVLIFLGGYFTPGVRNYRISMEAGYNEDEDPFVPEDLERLCIEICKTAYRENSAVLSESIGTWSRTYSEKLKSENSEIEETLSHYTRIPL